MARRTTGTARLAALLGGLLLLAAPASAGPPAIEYDCNGNGVEDAVDIAVGTSGDANWNGVPDECESVERTPPRERARARRPQRARPGAGPHDGAGRPAPTGPTPTRPAGAGRGPAAEAAAPAARGRPYAAEAPPARRVEPGPRLGRPS